MPIESETFPPTSKAKPNYVDEYFINEKENIWNQNEFNKRRKIFEQVSKFGNSCRSYALPVTPYSLQALVEIPQERVSNKVNKTPNVEKYKDITSLLYTTNYEVKRRNVGNSDTKTPRIAAENIEDYSDIDLEAGKCIFSMRKKEEHNLMSREKKIRKNVEPIRAVESEVKKRNTDNSDTKTMQIATENDQDEPALLDLEKNIGHSYLDKKELSLSREISDRSSSSELSNKENDDFDFAIVLQPNEVHSYWAEKLDFRDESLNHRSSRKIDLVFSPHHTPYRTTMTSCNNNSSLKQIKISELKPCRTIKKKSLFERALERMTPPKNNNNINKPNSQSSSCDVNQKDKNPVSSKQLKRDGNTVDKKRVNFDRKNSENIHCSKQPTTNNLSTPKETGIDVLSPIDLEKRFPSQVIPRGIAARNNGMQEFLQALSRGIVLRRLQALKKHYFIKLISHDGGDTILYEYVGPEEAKVALKEQGVRYNRRKGHQKIDEEKMNSSQKKEIYPNIRKPPSFSSDIPGCNLPDHVAARQYRGQMTTTQTLKKKVSDYYTKYMYSESFSTSNIIAVHPAQHNDPTELVVRGTKTLRLCPSDFHLERTFSIVLPSFQFFQKSNSESWFEGDNTASFNFIDLEAATNGEYWLVFRGLLLLHRYTSCSA